MNKKNKIYEGARYKFVIKKEIGSGGNGKVYDVDIIGHPKLDFVAKFFSADKRNLKKCNKRFERFKKEIEYVNKLTDIEGIMLIEDCNLSSMDNSWYLMKKAREYKVNTRKKLNEKLDDIMKIALVIKQLHYRDMEHRDIKPDNILILNNRVYLTDFGLIFCDNDIDNLTDLNERIGPGKIAPPEFSNLGAFSYIDFKASDVYLFAKVIWMILKEEPFGFYGPYKYGEDSKQLLLDEKKYSVETFIPINKLIHEATYDDFTKRINIDDCIGYIELQQKLISNNLNDDEKVIINNLKNEELLIKFKEDKCSKHIVSNKEFIAEFLQKNQFPSKIKICGTISDDKEEVKEKELLLEISRVRINHNYCQGYYFINKRKIYECHFIVNEIILNEEKQQFEFQLIEDERLWKYNNIIEARGNIVGKYYVPSNKKIVIDY